MKILYGSQNFGYNIDESDYDYIEFTIPTWETILNGSVNEKEIQCDTGLIKVKDIRTIRKILRKPNFSGMQFLYSVYYEDCECLQWFIDNRDKLLRADIFSVYKHNVPIIRQNIDTQKPKNMARAFSYMKILERVIKTDEIVSLNVTESRTLRCLCENNTNKEIIDTGINIMMRVDALESLYAEYKDKIDTDILKQADNELIRILKEQLK